MKPVTFGTTAVADSGMEGPESCRVLSDILDRIGDKWTVMVVGALADGPVRFNALLRAIDGVSHRMLTLTLRALQRDGLVSRRAYATNPPKVEYELTALGRSLIDPLQTLLAWARTNQPGILDARAAFEHYPPGKEI